MPNIIDDFCEFYKDLSIEKLSSLSFIYDEKIQFTDPVHDICGLDNMNEYFTKLIEDLSFCRFDVHDKFVQENTACLLWRMHFLHKNFGPKEGIFVTGASHLRFTEKITYHRDIFDIGEMFYEHVPVMGYLINKLKRRLAQ